MTQDYFKEQIKLETEWLRMYFILLLADVSGSAAIVIRVFRKEILIEDLISVLISFGFAFGLIILMVMKNKKIKQLINSLKTKTE